MRPFFGVRPLRLCRAGTWVDRCEFSADGRIVAGGFMRQVDLRRVSGGRCLVEIPIGGLPIFAFDRKGPA